MARGAADRCRSGRCWPGSAATWPARCGGCGSRRWSRWRPASWCFGRSTSRTRRWPALGVGAGRLADRRRAGRTGRARPRRHGVRRRGAAPPGRPAARRLGHDPGAHRHRRLRHGRGCSRPPGASRRPRCWASATAMAPGRLPAAPADASAPQDGPNYAAERAVISVTKAGRAVCTRHARPALLSGPAPDHLQGRDLPARRQRRLCGAGRAPRPAGAASRPGWCAPTGTPGRG